MWKLFSTTLAVVLTTALPNIRQAADPAVLDSGRGLFMTHCASCHGVSGRGNGPFAEELRRRPADLTQFAKQNGGVFNAAALHRIIDGRTVKAHGTMEMPVWGDTFKWRQGLPEEAIKTRIEAIVRYIESLQERAGD